MKNRLEGGFRHHKNREQNRRRKINQLAEDIHRSSQDYLDSLKKEIEENKKRELGPLAYLIERSRYSNTHVHEEQQNTQELPIPAEVDPVTLQANSRQSSLNAIVGTKGVYGGVGNSTGCVACRRRLWDPI